MVISPTSTATLGSKSTPEEVGRLQGKGKPSRFQIDIMTFNNKRYILQP